MALSCFEGKGGFTPVVIPRVLRCVLLFNLAIPKAFNRIASTLKATLNEGEIYVAHSMQIWRNKSGRCQSI